MLKFVPANQFQDWKKRLRARSRFSFLMPCLILISGCFTPAAEPEKFEFGIQRRYGLREPTQTKPALQNPNGPRVDFIEPPNEFHGMYPGGKLQPYSRWVGLRRIELTNQAIPWYYFVDLELRQITPPWSPRVRTASGRLTPYGTFVTFAPTIPKTPATTSSKTFVFQLEAQESFTIPLNQNAWSEQIAADGSCIVQSTGGVDSAIRIEYTELKQGGKQTNFQLPDDRRIKSNPVAQVKASAEWAVSPDGRLLAFVGPWLPSESSAHIEIRDAASGKLVSVLKETGTPNPPRDYRNKPLDATEMPITVSTIHFTADGKRIAFNLRYADNIPSTKRLQIEIESGKLVKPVFPAFSERLADYSTGRPYCVSRDGQYELWVRHVNAKAEWEFSLRDRFEMEESLPQLKAQKSEPETKTESWIKLPVKIVDPHDRKFYAAIVPASQGLVFVNTRTRTATWYDWKNEEYHVIGRTHKARDFIQLFSVTPNVVGTLRKGRSGKLTVEIFQPRNSK